jgi:hypothetical protein
MRGKSAPLLHGSSREFIRRQEYTSPPPGGNISRCHWGKNMKRGREKGEKCIIKRNKGEKRRKTGKRKRENGK